MESHQNFSLSLSLSPQQHYRVELRALYLLGRGSNSLAIIPVLTALVIYLLMYLFLRYGLAVCPGRPEL
jgi:hypothetical protein